MCVYSQKAVAIKVCTSGNQEKGAASRVAEPRFLFIYLPQCPTLNLRTKRI